MTLFKCAISMAVVGMACAIANAANTTATATSAKTTKRANRAPAATTSSVKAQPYQLFKFSDLKEFRIVPTVSMTNFGLDYKGKNFDRQKGLAIGVSGQSRFTPKIRGQAGIMYFEAGGEKEIILKGQRVNFDMDLKYLGFPVAALYDLEYQPTKLVSFYGKAGVLPAYMLRSNISADTAGGGNKQSFSTSTYRYDVMPSIGLGMESKEPNSKNSFLLEMNYYHGLMDMWEGSGRSQEAYNRGFMFSGSIAI